ncbi:multicopper oxidase family protein [Streptomyces sp. NPDC001315]|uniref:multicopper oxidase family protein n=1 Tax=Streptomyces sp. NPDC001315 TaxID=3364562 RepID=UPI003678E56A
MLHSRRGLLATAGASVTLASLPMGWAMSRPATAAASSPAPASAPAPAAEPGSAPFQVPLLVQSPLRPRRRAGVDHYELTTAETDATLLPGATTRIRSFNGTIAPLIVARRGRPVVIEQVNRLPVPFAMHLHGGHVPADSDGHPRDQLEPGRSRIFRYPNTQQASTMWLHDHSHHDHAENVYRGLAASYVLTDEFEDGLPLPKGRYDVTLQLRDAAFAADGSLVYDPDGFRRRPEYLVNGRPRPYFEVAARKYRLRLLNTSNERFFLLGLRGEGEIVQISSDGGLLPSPVPAATPGLWPAERSEVVVDFSRYPIGSQVVLENLAALPGEAPEVMRFDVVREADDPSRIPDRLRPVHDQGEAALEREVVLRFDPATGRHLINGQAFDMDRTDFRPRLGQTEIWKITNADTAFGIPHSLHIHLNHFTVVDRGGRPPAPAEAGLKDTVAVLAGETVRIKIKFTDYSGQFMYHCHLLQHQMMGMMGQMEITG